MGSNETKLYQLIMRDRTRQAEIIKAGSEADDTLTGGSGSDVFVFRMDDGNDTITDFTVNEDVLRFGGADFEDIDVRIENGNTIVTYGQTVITLEGVEMNKDQVWAHVDN